MSRLPGVAFLAGALLLAGCTTSPATRVSRNQEAFNSWPAEVQERVQAGDVAVGFTPEQVRVALGEPSNISTRTTEQGTVEVWSYRASRPAFSLGVGVGGGGGGSSVGGGVGVGTGGGQSERFRVVFDQGRVTAVERAQ